MEQPRYAKLVDLLPAEPMLFPTIIAIVATSTLCLKVYSSLILSALISTAIASLSDIALIRSFVMLLVVDVKSSETVSLYRY